MNNSTDLPIPDASIQQSLPKSRGEKQLMDALLFGGILLRFGIFLAAGPFNPDNHYEVIQYIAEHGSLPLSNQLVQSYHPPLYHLLMAPLEYLWHSPGPIHFVSFLISSFNLVLIRRILDHPLVLPFRGGRYIALAAACVLPQYVMFSSFVSNDTLTILIGTLIFLCFLRYIEKPSVNRLIAIAILIGAGLLTKGTFLLTGPAMAALVFWIKRRKESLRRAALITTVFCLVWLTIGSYKYIENYRHFGRPIVHNLEALPDVVASQSGVWKGLQTVYDINVLKLIRRPILQIHNTYSYPLLFYATFWYPHYPDSTLRGNVVGYHWVGSAIYALAVIPTLIFLYGLFRAFSTAWRMQDDRSILLAGSALLLISNSLVVFAAGIKYDTWASFQSRLCFQSMLPILVLFGAGLDRLRTVPSIRTITYAICWMTLACCAIYFLVELGIVTGVLLPGAEMSPG